MKKYIDRDRLADYAYIHYGGLTASDIMRFPTADFEFDNGWISVENRLPDDKKQYLVCTDRGRFYIAYYQPIGDKFSDYEPFWQSDSCRLTTCVTHWQPLPKRPKEVENETN